jgi:hypothetical protein
MSWGLDEVFDDPHSAAESHAHCECFAGGATAAIAKCKRLVDAGPPAGLDVALELESTLQGACAQPEEFARARANFRMAQ